MVWILSLTLFLLTAGAAIAQPFPVLHDQSNGSVVTDDARGRQYETFKTQTGWVTYGLGRGLYNSFKGSLPLDEKETNGKFHGKVLS